MSKDNKSSGFGAGIILGVIGGIALAVLCAPKSGEQTRKELAATFEEIKDKAVPEIVDAKNKLHKVFDKTKCKLEREYKKINDYYKAKKMAAAKNKENDIYCL